MFFVTTVYRMKKSPFFLTSSLFFERRSSLGCLEKWRIVRICVEKSPFHRNASSVYPYRQCNIQIVVSMYTQLRTYSSTSSYLGTFILTPLFLLILDLEGVKFYDGLFVKMTRWEEGLFRRHLRSINFLFLIWRMHKNSAFTSHLHLAMQKDRIEELRGFWICGDPSLFMVWFVFRGVFWKGGSVDALGKLQLYWLT